MLASGAQNATVRYRPARGLDVDVGASAGLNLLLPYYGYRYEPGGPVGSQTAWC